MIPIIVIIIIIINSNVNTYDFDEKKSINDNTNNNKNNIDRETVFSKIESDFTLTELKQHQRILKNELINLENNHKIEFDKLKNEIRKYNLASNDSIRQNELIPSWDENLMKEGIQTRKELSELPIDFESGFDGSNEYDYKIYLTNVLIFAHQINPIFQKDCEQFFESMNKKHKIKCKYTPAPVKTYCRCVDKAKLDYSDRKWPYSSHILDYVRCSVVFNDINTFLKGFDMFKKQYEPYLLHPLSKKQNGCIKCIVRIKNDFIELPNNIKDNLKLSDSTYRDIKCNVIIERNGTKIIGEIQFILQFMLDAKKRGHKSYAFMRNNDLYKQLNKLYYYDNIKNGINLDYLKPIIMNNNINKFSLFLQSMNKQEKQYFLNQKNQKEMQELLRFADFEKGEKLFKQFTCFNYAIENIFDQNNYLSFFWFFFLFLFFAGCFVFVFFVFFFFCFFRIRFSFFFCLAL